MAERSGRTALITGASAGLGADFSRLFAADGHDVVLVARRQERLEQLAEEVRAQGVRAHVVARDLAEPGAAQAIATSVGAKSIDIDFLVNNAGFGTNGAFVATDLRKELDMISVNIAALVHLTHLFLPSMLERGHGRVLNIGSTAGFQAGPFMATYYATKAFVNHFSEALWHEVKGTGVTVTVHCPGATATEFAQTAGNDSSLLFQQASMVADSDDVAKHAYAAMMSGKRMAVHGLFNKMIVQSARMAPRGMLHRIAERLNKA